MEPSQVTTLHCLGDSHTRVFANVAMGHCWKWTEFGVCAVDGATAMGVTNPNSRSNANVVFEEYSLSMRQGHHALYCLGEVDCGFVIWYRAQKHSESVTSQLLRAVQNYMTFVSVDHERRNSRTVVVSAPPPTIADGAQWGTVANLRKEIKASLDDRTKLTMEFNQRLEEHCKLRGFAYVNYFQDVVDADNHVLLEYLNANPLDHHLEPTTLSRVLIQKLMEIGYK